MKRVHLVCNAHLDPVWLWHWQDGWAEALATFRIAADFCERNPEFVFCHGEMLLYRWVEDYEPELFARIVQLVRAGRWHISGGAYLQPDVNAPHGESHIRHFLLAQEYFADRFGVTPRTAHNYDPFGHPEGYAQILAGCGMDHYVFCRPDATGWQLPVGPFRWTDRSGAEVIARRSDEHYSTWGNVEEKFSRFLAHYHDEPVSMILWGLGNHGGGPSREEYATVRAHIRSRADLDFRHSTPDAFFADHLATVGRDRLPRVAGEIQNICPGCYTSMARIKRAHRQTEAALLSTERCAAIAWWHGLAEYPAALLESAWKDLLFAQFHDILPGTGSPRAEADSLQLLAHARECCERAQLRLTHACIRHDPAPRPGEIPVFVTNPHGFPLRTQVEFECNLAYRSSLSRHPHITVSHDGRAVPLQRLHAETVSAKDWRVRLAAEVELEPFEIARLETAFIAGRAATVTPRAPTRANLRFTNEHFTLQIDPDTGLIDHFAPPRVRRSLLGPRAGAPALFRDLDHSWRCGTPGPGGDSDDLGPHGFHEDPLLLQLADAQQAHAIHPSHEHKYADGPEAGPPIRITEHGELQTMVEVLFVAGPTAVHRRYVVRHRDGLVEIRDRVWMNHRDHMLKLELPLARRPRELLADACYSAVTRTPDSEHQERPNGRWLAIDGLRDDPTRLAVLNSGSHAHACHDSSLYLACLRTPAYASFTIGPASDWHHACNRERMDLGEHELRFALALHAAPDEARIRREADLFNQPLSWQVFHPQPSRVARRIRKLAAGTVRVDDPAVQIVAVKRAQSGERLIVRLLETSGQPRQVRLHCSGGPAPRLHLPAHGLITVAIARQGSPRSQLVDLVERPETDAR